MVVWLLFNGGFPLFNVFELGFKAPELDIVRGFDTQDGSAEDQ